MTKIINPKNSHQTYEIDYNKEPPQWAEPLLAAAAIEKIKTDKKFHKELIKQFDYSVHTSFLPITSHRAEEAIWCAFKKTHKYKMREWDCDSHRESEDMHVDYLSIGVKGNKIQNNWFNISYCRTTKYKTIEEKEKFFMNTVRNVPLEFWILREKIKTQTRYCMFMIDKTMFKPLDMHQYKFSPMRNKKGNLTAWKSDKIDDFYYVINRSTSDQIWFLCDKLESFVNQPGVTMLLDKTYEKDIVGYLRV